MIFDSHCHLQFKAFDNDREQVIFRCVEKKIGLNIVGTQKDTSLQAVELAEKNKNFYATIGVHPIQHNIVKVKEEHTKFKSRAENFDEEFFNELVKSPKVIAVGETGLDLFHIPKNENIKNIQKKQEQLFLQHVKFARKNNLPLVIHVRDAHEEMIALLKNKVVDLKSGIKGVVHCFTGNWQEAREYLNLGLFIGFTGVITFPPKKIDPQPQLDLLEVVEKIPLDRLLVETDAPFLAPQAYRGERCEPWMTKEVLKFIAKRRGLEERKLEKIVEENFKKLFKLFNI